MRSHLSLSIGLLAAMAAGTAGAAAQEASVGSPLRLSLDQAIAQAVDNSHRLGELRARVEGATAGLDGRRASDRPQLSLLGGYTRTNHVQEFGIGLPGRAFQVIYPDIPDNYRARLDLEWPIYTFGRTAALERMAEAELRATGKDVEAARADLRLEVARAFWAVVTARETVGVVEQSLQRTEAQLEDVQNRLKVGLVAPNDVLSVQAQRSRQQMFLVQARNQRDVAVADLGRIVGAPPGTLVEPQAALEEPAPGELPAVETLVAEARGSRADRQALVERVAEAGERRQAADLARRPLLSIGGGVDYALPNPRIFPRIGEWRNSWDASVNLSWMLWDAGRTRAEVAGATSAERAVGERLADFDRALDVEVRQRWLDIRSARAAIDAATESVKAAAEARRVAGERFDAGVATSTDVLDAQVALLQAGLDRTQALATLRLAEARLDRAIGK